MVEFAVVLPVLLLFVLGILYFGRFEDYSNQATQLSEQGARMAAVGFMPTSGTLQSYLVSQAQPELQTNGTDVTKALQVFVYQPTNYSGWTVGQQVRVCVTYTMTFPTPLGTPSAPVTKMTTMRLESLGTYTSFPYSAGNGTIPSSCSYS